MVSLSFGRVVTYTDGFIFVQAAFEAYLERELPEIRKEACRLLPS